MAQATDIELTDPVLAAIDAELVSLSALSRNGRGIMEHSDVTTIIDGILTAASGHDEARVDELAALWATFLDDTGMVPIQSVINALLDTRNAFDS